jgi:hypothetical protein
MILLSRLAKVLVPFKESNNDTINITARELRISTCYYRFEVLSKEGTLVSSLVQLPCLMVPRHLLTQNRVVFSAAPEKTTCPDIPWPKTSLV